MVKKPNLLKVGNNVRITLLWSDVLQFTGIFSTHHNMENHDESSARLLAALEGVPKGVPVIAPYCATEKDLLRVHTSSTHPDDP